VSAWLRERILAFQGVYPSAEPEPGFHRGNLSDWLTEVIENGNAWAKAHVAGWGKAKTWDTQVQALEAHLDHAFPWVRAGKGETKKRLQALGLKSSERWLGLFHGARQGLASAEASLPRRLVTRLPRRERAGLMQEWQAMSLQGRETWIALHRTFLTEQQQYVAHLQSQVWVGARLKTIPRSILTQTASDFCKAQDAAFQDRRNGVKPARGFPTFQKATSEMGVRWQLDTRNKNNKNKIAWEADRLPWYRGTDAVGYRDSGYALPEAIPAMMSLTRTSSGEWFMSFSCTASDVLEAKAKRKWLKAQKDKTRPEAHMTLAKYLDGFEKAEQDRKGAWKKQIEQAWGLSHVKLVNQVPVDDEGFPVLESADISIGNSSLHFQHAGPSVDVSLKRNGKAVSRAHQDLSRKKIKSKGWERARLKLAKVYASGQAALSAAQQEVILQCFHKAALMAQEQLHVRGLMKSRYGAGFHRHAHGRFTKGFREVFSKTDSEGVLMRVFLQCDRWDSSTQTCSVCQFKNTQLKNNTKIRQWTCPQCETFHHRDGNASVNIGQMALRKALRDHQALVQAQKNWDEKKAQGKTQDEELKTPRPDPSKSDWVKIEQLYARVGKSPSEDPKLGFLWRAPVTWVTHEAVPDANEFALVKKKHNSHTRRARGSSGRKASALPQQRQTGPLSSPSGAWVSPIDSGFPEAPFERVAPPSSASLLGTGRGEGRRKL